MRLLILGASARAAATSAARAGFAPLSIDLFNDRDLLAVGEAWRIEPSAYPEGFATLAAEVPPCPWIYTGALENHPDLIARIARTRPLWGVAGAALRACRDPFRVYDVLRKAGLCCPMVRDREAGLPLDASWLVKLRHSRGGLGIQVLTRDTVAPAGPVYYQQYVGGTPLSAVFVGGDEEASLLGVTRQRIGRKGSPFAYAGSIGPWPVPAATRRQLCKAANMLVRDAFLRGIFGIDFVLRDQDTWPVEVNPRYTASVEVLELAAGQGFLGRHAASFGAFPPEPAPEAPIRARPGLVGKAILYADRPCRFPDRCAWRPGGRKPFEWKGIADIPRPGERFEPGQPVLTVLVRASSPHACKRRLDQALERWQARLVPT
jgi:predicted ATP-grasp superfamily ATP-dependent carboligase